MDKSFIRLQVLDQLLVKLNPLSDDLILQYTGGDPDELEELENFIDSIEDLDTPLSIKKLSGLCGIPQAQLEDLEREGIMNLKGILK